MGRRGKLLGSALVALAALFPGEARPTGGVGGGAAAGSGGANSLEGFGGAGAAGSSASSTGGSGGGAGVRGGTGGSVVGGGAGGAGGTTAGASGGSGIRNIAGSGGGGGGAHGFVGAGLPTAVANGGGGGSGGSGSTVRGGGGGAGGFGAVVTGDGALGRLSFRIRGGGGGAGGLANLGTEADNGAAGSAGVGLYLSGVAPSLTLGANITGGEGGARHPTVGGDALVSTSGMTLVIETGVSVTGGLGGFVTGSVRVARGHGIVGSGMHVSNAGTITGTDALRFEGGANSLTLMAGSVITGNINLRNASTLAITPEAGGSTLSAPLIGDGTLIKAGQGTLTLTGASTHTGGTTISAGTLRVGNGGATGSLAGAIANNATLAFHRSDDIALANAISGTGALVQSGPGRLTLQGALTYTGETRVEGGTLALTQADLLTSGAAPFHVAAGATLDLSGVAGSGALAMGALTGAGSLVTAATARRLSLGGSGTFSGVISGGAELAVTQGATVELSGVNSYTGVTRVEQDATLRVNGSIASSRALEVASGTVGGTGTLPGASFGAQGRLSPGNSIGTLIVRGDLTMQPGSTMVLEVRGEAADRVNVTGAAQLAGDVRLVPLGGAYRFNAPYTLLQAARVTGSPSLVTQGGFGAGITVALNLGATTMQMVLTPAILVAPPAAEEPAAAPSPLPPEAAPPTPEAPRVVVSPGLGLPGPLPTNLRAAAAALDRANRAGADLSPFFNVYNQPAGSIGAAVNQLSGEVATGTAAMGFTSGTQFLATMLDPQGQGREGMGGRLWLGGDGDDQGEGPARPAFAAWGMAMGAYGRAGGDAAEGVAARTARMAGFAIGLDYNISPRSMAGLALSVGESRTSLAGGLGNSQANFGQIGAYGMTRLGSFTLSGAAALTWLQVESRRSLAIFGGDPQSADFGVRAQALRGEVRQDGLALGGFRLQPLVALQWQQMNNQAYAESSPLTGRLLGVAVGAQSQSSLRVEAGAQIEGVVPIGGRAAQVQLRAAWAHDAWRDAAMSVGFAGLPNSGFILQGARQDANAALLSAGLEVPVAPRLTLGARLDGEFSSHLVQLAGMARLRYLF